MVCYIMVQVFTAFVLLRRAVTGAPMVLWLGHCLIRTNSVCHMEFLREALASSEFEASSCEVLIFSSILKR